MDSSERSSDPLGYRSAGIVETGDNSYGPTSTGVGTDGTTSTRAKDSDGGATSEQETSLEEDRGQELHLHES